MLDYLKLPLGDKAPEVVNVVVEIPLLSLPSCFPQVVQFPCLLDVGAAHVEPPGQQQVRHAAHAGPTDPHQVEAAPPGCVGRGSIAPDAISGNARRRVESG